MSEGSQLPRTAHVSAHSVLPQHFSLWTVLFAAGHPDVFGQADRSSNAAFQKGRLEVEYALAVPVYKNHANQWIRLAAIVFQANAAKMHHPTAYPSGAEQ